MSGASLFWESGERQSQGETTYEACVLTYYHCGKCGIQLPEGVGVVRCVRGHKNMVAVKMSNQVSR